MSLRLRVVLTFGLLTALSFSGILWLTIRDVRPRYLEAVEESVVDTAELLAAVLSSHAVEGRLPLEEMDRTMAALSLRHLSARIYNIHKQRVNLIIHITDAKGVLLYDSSGRTRPGADFSQWRDIHLTLRGKYGARSSRAIPDDPASQVIFVAAPIQQDGKLVGVVSVGKPTNSITFLTAIARKRLTLGLGLLGMVALVLSAGLSHWVTRPVRQLTAYALAIRRGEQRDLPPTASPEIQLLGSAMREMQTQLEGKAYVEDYVRSLTHELKSPLTGIKGAAEILRDLVREPEARKFLDNLDADAERLRSLVDRMLELSRLENVRTVSKTRFPAGPFLSSILDGFAPEARARNLALDCQIGANLELEGDHLLLRQAVANLIANALDFSPPGGRIRISALRERDRILITVEDQGTGIPDFALDKVFDKFFSLSRPDTGKKSTGLGLPFVAEVCNLHGGGVRLKNLPQAGLAVTLSLPGFSSGREAGTRKSAEGQSRSAGEMV